MGDQIRADAGCFPVPDDEIERFKLNIEAADYRTSADARVAVLKKKVSDLEAALIEARTRDVVSSKRSSATVTVAANCVFMTQPGVDSTISEDGTMQVINTLIMITIYCSFSEKQSEQSSIYLLARYCAACLNEAGSSRGGQASSLIARHAKTTSCSCHLPVALCLGIYKNSTPLPHSSSKAAGVHSTRQASVLPKP